MKSINIFKENSMLKEENNMLKEENNMLKKDIYELKRIVKHWKECNCNCVASYKIGYIDGKDAAYYDVIRLVKKEKN